VLIDYLKTTESITAANRSLFQFDKMGPGGEMGGIPGIEGGAGWSIRRTKKSDYSSRDIKIKKTYK